MRPSSIGTDTARSPDAAHGRADTDIVNLDAAVSAAEKLGRAIRDAAVTHGPYAGVSSVTEALEPSAHVKAQKVAAALEGVATHLVTGGMLFGPDRVHNRTQWGYGDDRVVGLAIAVEVAAALGTDAIRLLELGRRYGAAALVRQLIECEHLIWLFASDAEEARRWLNADDAGLRRMFKPSRIRERSAGRFDVEEYRSHCGLGGHPSPVARSLLPAHSLAAPIDVQWKDLTMHLARTWRTLMEAVDALGVAAYVPSGLTDSVSAAINSARDET